MYMFVKNIPNIPTPRTRYGSLPLKGVTPEFWEDLGASFFSWTDVHMSRGFLVGFQSEDVILKPVVLVVRIYPVSRRTDE